MSQFAFLRHEWPGVFHAAARAERQVHRDPRVAIGLCAFSGTNR